MVSSYRNSTDLPPQVSSPVASAQVSWQSAFWALAAIALNTCLHESGETLGLDAEFAASLRSSPIVCVLDSLVIWVQLIICVRRGPLKAVREVAKARQQTASRVSLHELTVSLLLALLATLQAVKLFALRGVPWAQACGAAFLLSYVTNALLNTFGQSVQPVERVQWPDKYLKAIASFAILLQLSCWMLITTKLWSVALADGDSIALMFSFVLSIIPAQILTYVAFALGFGIWLLVAMAMIGVPVLLATGIVLLMNRISRWLVRNIAALLGISEPGLGTISGIILATTFLSLEVYYINTRPFNWIWDNTIEAWLFFFKNTTMFGGLVAPCSILAVYFIFAYFITVLKRNITKDADKPTPYWWFVIFANMLLTFLYFRFLYVPDGTVKPPWTENLG